MEKKGNLILKSISCLSFVIVAFFTLIMAIRTFINMMDIGGAEAIITGIICFVLEAGLALSYGYFGFRLLLNARDKKECSDLLVILLLIIAGGVLFLANFLYLAINGLWDSQILWIESLVGLSVVVLAILGKFLRSRLMELLAFFIFLAFNLLMSLQGLGGRDYVSFVMYLLVILAFLPFLLVSFNNFMKKEEQPQKEEPKEEKAEEEPAEEPQE